MTLVFDSFSAAIDDVCESYPAMGEVLRSANAGRLIRIQAFMQPPHCKAYEAILKYFADARDEWQASPNLRPVSFLPSRLGGDFSIALEAFLSGMLAVVNDTMRDVIEIDMLIRDFVANDDRLTMWIGSDLQLRRDHFAPAQVRRRVARSLGVSPDAVPGTTDYRAHSQLLHVAPPILYQRAIGVNRVSAALDALADVLFHARSASATCSLLSTKHNAASTELSGVQSSVTIALELLEQSSAGAHGIEKAVTSLLGLKEGSVHLLENGNVVAFDEQRGIWETYVSEQPIRLSDLYKRVRTAGSVPLTLKRVATWGPVSMPSEEALPGDNQPGG